MNLHVRRIAATAANRFCRIRRINVDIDRPVRVCHPTNAVGVEKVTPDRGPGGIKSIPSILEKSSLSAPETKSVITSNCPLPAGESKTLRNLNVSGAPLFPGQYTPG